jgi:hypothetical protein
MSDAVPLRAEFARRDFRFTLNRRGTHRTPISTEMSAWRLESHDLCPGEAITARDVCGVGISCRFTRPRESILRFWRYRVPDAAHVVVQVLYEGYPRFGVAFAPAPGFLERQSQACWWGL